MEDLCYLYSVAVAAGGIAGFVRKGENVAHAVVPSVCVGTLFFSSVTLRFPSLLFTVPPHRPFLYSLFTPPFSLPPLCEAGPKCS